MRPASVDRRYWVTAGALAMLPDADVVFWFLGVPDDSLLAHRALTHSIAFAIVAGGIAAWSLARGAPWPRRAWLWLVFAVATASHGIFDGLTSVHLGIEYFAPFSQQRYRMPWQPMDGRGWPWAVLGKELLYVYLPAALLGGIGWLAHRAVRLGRLRRRKVDVSA